ncbi:glutathione S-transferase family protein [Myxococcota bacterium]|nr:glutathione S-transferase family protein [Myxococcota bacterium]MCZ7616820.1 glutathione S-transferase family protein [Myxococcota bacterium]
MIRLHTARTPNGRKVSIALEEIGVPYEPVWVQLDQLEQMAPAFRALNPNHKIPVLEDDGVVVWESGAILLYLAEKYGQLLPADPVGRIHAIQYAFFQTGGIGPNLGRLAAQLRKPIPERSREVVELFGDEVSRLLVVLDQILADGRPFLAGEYSIADIMHYPWLTILLDMKAPPLLERERVVAWLERIGERPAVQRGMAVP